MSGPDYPPQPGSLSNAIGVFAIGGSQIGSIPVFKIWNTIISQYANSPVITTLILNMFQSLDQTRNMDDFFDLIWNIDTAQGYGLDVWGRILAVNRVLKIINPSPYFGFEEGVDYQPFGPGGLGPFYKGQPFTQNEILNDDGFRVLLLAKAFSNICDGSILSINTLLQTFFKAFGKAYVVDNENMSFAYTFEFPLSPLQAAIVTNSGVFPKPTGVSYTIVQI